MVRLQREGHALPELRDRIAEVATRGQNARTEQGREDADRQIGQLRAQACADAWSAHPGRNVDGHLSVPVRAGGTVRFAAVEVSEGDGATSVEVHLDGEVVGGDPHFRIINPPMLVEDPDGGIEVGGFRYREDPLAALAEVIARHGGGAR